MARPLGIEPRSQAPEAYVISIGPRAQTWIARFIIGDRDRKSKVKAKNKKAKKKMAEKAVT
jgi:hypothetical protein